MCGVYPDHLINASTRLSRRSSADLLVIQRATTRIEEVSASLDQQLLREQRSTEQVRILRGATSQITRAANDGIQAYRRVSAGIQAERERSDIDPLEIVRMTESLARAREGMLEVLEVASRRYPWAKRWRSIEA
jgi:hypothetical protein